MSPEALIEDLRRSRKNFLAVVQSVPRERWTEIPKGFNNHLLWNLAHVVVTQQLLLYRLSGLEAQVSDELIEAYRKGSFPKPKVEEREVEEVLLLATSTVEQLEADWEAGVFEGVDFEQYPTSFGVTLYEPEDALRFNNMHDALHLGYAMAMRKLLA